MPTSQEQITDATPMGATLIDGGATFRVWAPRARSVHVVTDVAASRAPEWEPSDETLLVRRADGTWAGFVAEVADGSPYHFWVDGEGGQGVKRDPYAREMGLDPAFPHCDCVARPAHGYRWRSDGFRPPEFRDLILYQLHVGSFWAVDADDNDVRTQRPGRFLDLLGRIEYLRDLGVNGVQLLPIQEFPTEFSMGYNGTDLFSPESEFQVHSAGELQEYVERANVLLAKLGARATSADELRSGPNQLKLVIDLCHLHGLAVLFDVVYNHAGGDFGDESLYFLDRARRTSNANSLYFTEQGWAGGLVFDYAAPGVRQFLIDNAVQLMQEYRIDGLRYDELSVADRFGGWRFCQDLAATVQYVKPEAVQIAEYWGASPWLAVTAQPQGMGFDAAWTGHLMDPIRAAVRQASFGADASVSMGWIAEGLRSPPDFPDHWRALQYVENHDTVYARSDPSEWKPRIARLADASDPRSWWARSRARVATGLLLTAPGIPMLFMGQEILEDENWSDDVHAPGSLVWWDGLAQDRAMRDHLQFVRDLVWLRRRSPALRGEEINVYHARDDSRVLAFHRWIAGEGLDVVVVASLNELTYDRYQLGFPLGGRWREAFNSDYYDFAPNPQCAGNAGEITAVDDARDGMQWSATLVIPANGLLVFVRE